MKIIALYSIKGGVGKTAASVNLSYLAARDGHPTLLCDLDPQGAASFYFRIRAPKPHSSKKLLKGGRFLDRSIRGTDYPMLDLLPSNLSYRNLDLVLDQKKGARKRLRRIFSRLDGEYDFLFLDCPPNITLVAESVFRAADALIVPLIPTTLSVNTHIRLWKFFVDRNLDTSRIHGFFSMVEARKAMHRDITERLIRNGQFLKTSIPYRAEVEKMGIHREPLPCYSPDGPAALAFERLWREIRALTRLDRAGSKAR